MEHLQQLPLDPVLDDVMEGLEQLLGGVVEVCGVVLDDVLELAEGEVGVAGWWGRGGGAGG